MKKDSDCCKTCQWRLREMLIIGRELRGVLLSSHFEAYKAWFGEVRVACKGGPEVEDCREMQHGY